MAPTYDDPLVTAQTSDHIMRVASRLLPVFVGLLLTWGAVMITAHVVALPLLQKAPRAWVSDAPQARQPTGWVQRQMSGFAKATVR